MKETGPMQEMLEEYRKSLKISTSPDGHVQFFCNPDKSHCDSHHCMFCDGGLFSCSVCKGFEGSVPTDCPRREMSKWEGDNVYAGTINFVEGQWVVVDTSLGITPNFLRSPGWKPNFETDGTEGRGRAGWKSHGEPDRLQIDLLSAATRLLQLRYDHGLFGKIDEQLFLKVLLTDLPRLQSHITGETMAWLFDASKKGGENER